MKRFSRVLAGLFLVACSSDGFPGEGKGIGGIGTHLSDASSAPDTWATFAEAFFSKYCVSCHDGTTMSNGALIVGDFRSFDDVMQHKGDIRCGVGLTVLAGCEQSNWPPKQFPAGSGPKPTDAERERLVAWIDAGLPR